MMSWTEGNITAMSLYGNSMFVMSVFSVIKQSQLIQTNPVLIK